MYVNNHTRFSLKYGILSVKELLEFAQEQGLSRLAITDINNTSAAMDFVRLAPKYGVDPVLGIDFRNGIRQCYVALALNMKGFLEMNRFLSGHLHRGEPIPARAPLFEHVLVIYPFGVYTGFPLRPNEYIGVSPANLNKLRFSPLCADRDKLVALQTATFRNKRDFNTHRLLRAVDRNVLLSKLSVSEQSEAGCYFFPVDELLHKYREWPHLVENAERLLGMCTVELDLQGDVPQKNQRTYTGSEEEDLKLLRQLCESGMPYRYPNPDRDLLERLEKEIDIIHRKGFVSYFLISWDIVRYAREKGYFYVGRGSGANSMVAYLLRITDVDPVDLDLFFERFINLYRTNPPDFDIDFSWTDRDDVTRYIFSRFRHVALLATYSTFQFRATVRELGKVFGLPKQEIDRISSGRFVYERLDDLSKLVIRYSRFVHDFPSHLSIHAGGILISEDPIEQYTATFMPPKGFPTTQFDMITAEDVGLYKFDILSQRGLGKIKDALEIIRENNPGSEPIDIHDMNRFRSDEQIKINLREGKAIGCFYVESPAMRMLLQKLRVDDYLGLVAASSVIRPGVAKSGMMREYILRFRNPARRPDPDDVMMRIMPETYGVMVYQEDVIKVAHYFAGLSLGEADVLRRGMSGKFRSREEFARVQEKFFENCRKQGHSDELSAEVWRQVESFAGYAFAKGHSASYAVESYQSLFLKAYYPIEYMVATINNGGGFYSPELYLNEARLHGASVEEPCVNRSGALSIVRGRTIFLGFHRIRSMDYASIECILESRLLQGPFRSLPDFIARVAISLDQLVLLIRAGAFRFTGLNKKALLWKAHFLLGHSRRSKPERTLFRQEPREYQLPQLLTEAHEDAFDQMELFGFPLCNPFDLLTQPLREGVTAAELPLHKGETVRALGYLIHIKKTTTAGGKLMYFGTFLDREGGFLDTVHFPPYTTKYPFRGKGIYRIEGVLMEEFGAFTIEVRAMEILPMIQDPRYTDMSVYEQQMLRQTRKQRMNTSIN
ncbi:MAG: DNA polymerase III subunit alpha [Flavobacteriales bacterium]|nr:DNA polymerase III subunit alpha [Flavobacteriales bacterium]